MTLTGAVRELDQVYDHAPGWRDLLAELRAALEALPVEVHVDRCKEKWGGLRLDYELAGDAPPELVQRVEQLVYDAELRSLKICFVCGAPQTHVGAGHWVRYFCDEHDTGDARRLNVT